MTRTLRRAGTAVIAPGLLLAAGACSALGDTDSNPSCAASVAAFEDAVHTTAEFREDLPGFGDYQEIHWQGKALGTTCDRLPIGPTDWKYDLVLRLRHDQAAAIAKKMHGDDSPAPAIAPKLAPFVPAGVTWLHDTAWDDGESGTKWMSLWLDPTRDLAYVTLQDH